MCWPYSFRRRKPMNFGPRKMERSRATTPAIRTRLTGRPADGPRVDRSVQTDARAKPARAEDAVASAGSSVHRRQRLRDHLEPDRAGPLYEHAIAGLDDLLGGSDGRPRVRAPAGHGDPCSSLEIAARELPDGDERLHPVRRGQLSDFLVEGRPA